MSIVASNGTTLYLSRGGKDYLADKKLFYAHLTPRGLAIGLAKAGIVQGILVLAEVGTEWAESLDEEEDEEEDEKPFDSLPSPKEFGRRVAFAATRALTTITITRSLEELAIRYLRVEVAGKLVKDTAKSALRKSYRTGNKLVAARMILTTGMKSSLLSHMSVFIVEEALFLVRLYRRRKRRARSIDEDALLLLAEDNKSFFQVTVMNLVKMTAAVLASGVGAAIGTAILPGMGTTYGQVAGDSLVYCL